MKNRVGYKKALIYSVIISLTIIILISLISALEYRSYTNNFNNKISNIVSKIREEYPEISEAEIMEILLSKNNNNEILKTYSIDLNHKSLIPLNNTLFYKYLILNITLVISPFLLTLLIFSLYEKKKSKEIREITKYIEDINRKNYKLYIDEMSEDELSILKSEIYKTTIMLKEEAENSKKDKLELKESLSDISHQLKTPLTSILIMLDNLLDNPEMNKETKEDFIIDIKREIININFLVQSLLKLSKLDTSTVKFILTDVLVSKLINESIKNVALLSDLKNINIESSITTNVTIKCDEKWQIEAITNIIKNSIEHSYENNKIIIKVTDNKVYTEITIQDFGEGINKKDIKHIFDRFYKGQNSNHDSIGIGLALSKSIIEKNNGRISVQSNENGTIFIIKYFK